MSATITLCSSCGGAIVANGQSHYGKRCHCTNGAGVATATAVAPMTDASASMSMGHKLCCKCGSDVTHAKRMKDHLGRYWCYECGAADQLKRGSGLALRCPDCKKHFPPTRMLKHGEEYVCETCHEERLKHGSGLMSFSGGKFVKALFALLLVGAGAALIAMYVLEMELF